MLKLVKWKKNGELQVETEGCKFLQTNILLQFHIWKI